MVSTHAWKAASSPLPHAAGGATQSQSQSSPFLRSPFGNDANAGGPGGLGGAAGAAGGPSRPFIGGSDPKPPSAGGGGGAGARNFESLLANSASLLSSMGRGGGGASALGGATGGGGTTGATGAPLALGALGEKSLLELNVASRAGLGGAPAATVTTTYEAEASAHRLLAREGFGFDSARLGRRARDLERRAGASSSADGGAARMEEEKKEGAESEPGLFGGAGHASGGGEAHPLADLSGASLQQVLASHHEYCVRTALRRAREWTTAQAEKRVEERIQSDWERERSRILGRGALGNRFLLGSGGGGGVRGVGEPGAEGGVASRVPLLEGEAPGGGTGAASTYSDIIPSPQILPGEAEGLIKSHLAAIDKHLTSQPQDTNATKLVASLQEGLEAFAANGQLNPDSVGAYSNALSLLQSIINCGATLGDANNGSDDGYAAAVGAMGTLDHLARQFGAHVRGTVRDAALAGASPTSPSNNRLTGGTARDACAYAALATGKDVAEGRGGVWVRLFYCESLSARR